MSDNPYAPSGASFGNLDSGLNSDLTQAELIRKSHLNHEANIQGFGCLYMLGGVLSILGSLSYIGMGIYMASGALPVPPPNPNAPGPNVNPAVVGGTLALMGAFFLLVGISQLVGGRAMHTLNPRGKIFAIIVSALGLLAVPCGTILSAYLLYLLLSSKGEMVFSDAYREIRLATPHIKYKTSILVWILLFLLLGLIAIGILAALFGS